MAWEIFLDDCLCRITGLASGGYRVRIFDPNRGVTDETTLPAGTTLVEAKALGHKMVLEASPRGLAHSRPRLAGQVKWYNNAQGYGFILRGSLAPLSPSEGTSITRDIPAVDNDVFVHWSSILMDGERDLLERENVEFELRQTDRGWAAANLIRSVHSDSDGFREYLQIKSDRIAVVMLDGRIRFARMSPERGLQYLDPQKRFHGLLYLPSTAFGTYHEAIDELESLLNQHGVREEALHDFFERYPEFILMDEHRAAHSKIVLESDLGEVLIPDFVLEPIGQNRLCDLLELKLPTARVEVLQDRRERFAATLLEACAQLRTYRDYFEENANRQRFRERYGLEAFRPKLYVIIGRRGTIDPIEWRRAEGDLPMLHVKTYDDILERAKHTLARFGALRL